MSNKPFDFLDWSLDDLALIDGLKGDSHVAAIADGQDFLGSLDEYRKSTRQTFNKFSPKAAPHGRQLPTRDEVIDRLLPFLTGYNVLQMPEGWGKSSIVGAAVRAGRKVLFCCRTNAQVVEQEASFRNRWPEMRIARYVSKGRHLQEELAKLGVPFEPMYYEARSPYSAAAIDEPSTRQALRRALDEHGYQDVEHMALFDRLYKTYRAPRIIGKDIDVIMCTLAAFQGFCTTKHRPWWVALGFATGMKRVFEPDFEPHPLHRTFRPIVPAEAKVKKPSRTADIGIGGITVIIDDPAYTDFDFRRLVEAKDAVHLHHSYAQVPEYQREWRYVQHWLDKGFGEMTARALAERHAKEAQAHEITRSQDWYFEERPLPQHIAFGLRRGYSRDEAAPGILVLTTEHITAKLASMTLKKMNGQRRSRFTTFMKPNKITSNRGGWVFDEESREVWGEKLKQLWRGVEWLPTNAVSKDCHVTLLMTKLVRRSNKALLLLVHSKLREEFPDEDLTFIGDGLGLDLNLTNNRGRNDLADKHSLIKLSVPHRDVAVHLWAQFQGADPRALNTILLADLANQAIGRNQGHRWQRKTCTVLIDPMYADKLVVSDLLRYSPTPWSFHEPTSARLTFHGPITELEQRLKYWLVPANAHRLGVSVEGFKLGVQLPPKQREHYEAWLDANSGTDPGILKRWEERQ